MKKVKNWLFGNEPLENLARILTMIMVSISGSSTIVGMIWYIAEGGYAKQLQAVKTLNWDTIEQSFTAGTAIILVTGVIPKVVGVMFLVEVIALLIQYFRFADKMECVVMVIDLCLMMLAVLIFWQTEGLSKYPEWIHRKNTQVILILYTIVTIVVIIVFVSSMANSVGGSFLKYALATLGLHFIALPLAMLLLQNIISLVVAIVALALLCLIIYIAIQFLLISGGSEGGETIAPASSSGMHRNVTSKSEKKDSRPAYERDQNPNHHYIQDYRGMGGNYLYKRHGQTGDYIELENPVTTRRICSLEEAKRGTHKFYRRDSGREIRVEEIPWKE